jgi:hypothetical protein
VCRAGIFGGIGSAPVKIRGHPGPRAALRVNELVRPQQPLSAHAVEDFRMILQPALPRAALRPKVALDSRAGQTRVEQPKEPAAPNVVELHEIAAAKERGRKRHPRVALNFQEPKPRHVLLSCPHTDYQGWQARLQDALGTTSVAFTEVEINRLLTVFYKAGIVDANAVNAALAMIDGLKPQNEAEAMLAVQIAATHDHVMNFSARLGRGDSVQEQDFVSLTLSRLHRAFTTQLETLSNMRRGGRQKVVVEQVHIHKHVNVYPGAQAIVGDVTHTGRGVADENSGQGHAADDKRAIATEECPPMWCQDSARETVSVTGREGQAALSDARGIARLGSTKGQAERKLSSRLLHRGGNGRASRTPNCQTSPSLRACFQYAYSERLKSMYSGERSLEYMMYSAVP